eukprot:gb/GFBE01004057.1/.p1 GENE.gb/GFBE01004057.1/~~gb/GFBE01004057.1/.p1  ORF type:complete len:236 (+),score=46.33 gb/GFBE01004057.1/:1-708(+)
MACPSGLSGKVCIFDVNETMLDLLGTLSPVCKSLVGRDGAYEEWFRQLILMAHVLTISGSYKPFGSLAPIALEQVAANSGVTGKRMELPEDAWPQMKEAMGKLCAHEDVAPGLDALKAQGWQLVAFSNSDPAGLAAQLKNAGIFDKFDAVLSVDAVQKYKPHPDVYHYALKQVGVEAKDSVMVAAHDWDLEGARSVGMQTAFVRRHLGYSGAYKAAEVYADDFCDLASKLGAAAK